MINLYFDPNLVSIKAPKSSERGWQSSLLRGGGMRYGRQLSRLLSKVLPSFRGWWMRKRNGEGASGRAVQKQIINQDKAKTRQKRFAWISYYYYHHYDTITKPCCMFYHRKQRDSVTGIIKTCRPKVQTIFMSLT